MTEEAPTGSSRIFISYRREDAIAHVNALFHPLRNRFGEDRVFKDTDNIAPGQDFTKVIQSQLKTCSVLLAVIGKHWLTAQKSRSATRRIDDPADYLRVEIVTALKNDSVLVIPILVGEATMPAADELPEELAALSYRNGFELRDSRWESDVNLLIKAIEKACGETPSTEVRPARRAAQARGAAAGDKAPADRGGGIERLAARRQHQIAEHVTAARTALEASQYEEALEACERALWLDPQDDDARDLQQRAQAALDAVKIEGWLADARGLISGQHVQDAQLTAASELIDQAIAVDAAHEGATALRQQILALRRERERHRDEARHVRAVLGRARENLELDEFDACIAGCDDALTVSADSAEALDLRKRAVAARDERRRNRESRQRAERERAQSVPVPAPIPAAAPVSVPVPAPVSVPLPVAAPVVAAVAPAVILPAAPSAPAAVPGPSAEHRSPRTMIVGASAAAVVLIAGVVAWAVFGSSGRDGTAGPPPKAVSEPSTTAASPAPTPQTAPPVSAPAAPPVDPPASGPSSSASTVPAVAPAGQPNASAPPPAGPSAGGAAPGAPAIGSTTRPLPTTGHPAAQKGLGQHREPDAAVPSKNADPGIVAPNAAPQPAPAIPPSSPKDAGTAATRKSAAEKESNQLPPASPKAAATDARTERAAKAAPEPAAGGGGKEPTRLKHVAPVYPKAALDAGAQGVVILEATIGEDGHIRDVKVLRSIPLLDQAAIDAVKQWEYMPTIVSGKAVPIVIAITLTFAI